ncbi:BAG molecular chaperone regulator 1 [Dissophora globulifera]|nr:BAG molecular chaperone regulator 1 [Dissophora globulifera]
MRVHHQQYDPATVLHIRWNEEAYTIDFEGKVLAQIKLRELREICKDLTGVPLGGLSLIFGGATMKDDNAPLSCWGVKPGSKVVVDGIKPTEEEIKLLTTNGDPEEYALILRISGSLEKSRDSVSEFLPRYREETDAYLASSEKPTASKGAGAAGPVTLQNMSPPRKKLHDLHGTMSESLLQSLLVLDGVTCKPEFEVARVKRREAVKETQKLLDVIDAINAQVKESDNKARL